VSFISRAAEVLDARARRMLADRTVASVVVAAATLPLPGGADLAPAVLGLGLTGGGLAALASRWVGPLRGRVLAWASLALDVLLATLFVYATGGASSPAFSLYALAFLTPLALREPSATVLAGLGAGAGFVTAATLYGPVPAGPVLLRLGILGALGIAAVRMQSERRALLREHDRRVEELSAINAMAHELTAILDPDALLRRVAGLVRERFAHVQVRVGILSGDRLLVRRGDTGAAELCSLDDASLLAEAARTGTTAVGTGGATGPSAVALPLLAGGRRRGALEVTARPSAGGRRTGVFGDRDIRSLEAIAAFTAVALENADLHQSALRSALVDPLTGLFNVRYLQETLGGALDRAAASGRPFSILMLDVDNLREVNNRCGHLVGDGALREVARVIGSATRGGDIAARYGGDEFLLALPDAGPEAAAAVAERIRREVEAIPLTHRGQAVPLTVSIGVASLPHDGTTLQALVEAADRAAYRAKARGRNRIALLASLDDLVVTPPAAETR
jgi:diguanylate cyclase (GGDEF)-like protein